MANEEKSHAREQWARQSDARRTDFARAESPVKYQAAAWALWIVGLASAFGAALCASNAVHVPVLSDIPALTVVFVVVIDLAAVLVAQRLWRKAASLPGSKGSKVLGVVMACLAFAPMCLFFLAAKNAGGRTKGLAVGAALVSVAGLVLCCVLLGGASTEGAGIV